MFSRNTQFVVLLAVFGCALASYKVPVPVATVSYAPAVQQAANLPSLGDATASALSNAAGAAASAAKLDNSNRAALDAYGHQIGVPLLAKPYGAASSLYAAALPPRSFVGAIEPAFVKDSYGNVKHIGEARIAVIAI